MRFPEATMRIRHLSESLDDRRLSITCESAVFRLRVRTTEPSPVAYNGRVKRYGSTAPSPMPSTRSVTAGELLMRELMLGQRRYTDLADALPGIGSNILTSRLRA